MSNRPSCFVVRVEGLPVRFEDRIETVPSDGEATRFTSEDEAVKRVLTARRSLRGVAVVEVPDRCAASAAEGLNRTNLRWPSE